MPPKPGRPFVLSETTWKTVRDTPYEVAVLPWGATEAHNLHLPYGTDVIQCDFVAAESARIAWAQGAKVIVLPTVPFGVNTGQLDIKLDINMNPSTQAAVLGDVVESLFGQGIFKLVIVNGHGGNDFRQMIRELQPRYPDMFLGALHWYKVIDDTVFFDHPGDHAGEMETSVMLHIANQWVLPLSEAGNGAQRQPKLQAYRDGWVWTQRRWSKATKDTGVGDPAASTSDKGKRYFQAVTEKIGHFLVELAQCDTDRLYD